MSATEYPAVAGSTRNKPASYPNALKLPPYLHPAPPPTPSLTSSAASLPTPYVTLPLPCLCPSVPVQRHEYEYEYEQYPAHPSARQLINKPTALPYRIRVPFFTVRVRYWPRPASSAPALFILVLYPLPKREVVRVQRVTSFRKGIWQERCSPLTVQNLLELR